MIDAERLQGRLDAVGLTANAASERAGLSRDYVRDLLRGRVKEPSARALTNLAGVLDTTPDYLLGLSNEEKVPPLVSDTLRWRRELETGAIGEQTRQNIEERSQRSDADLIRSLSESIGLELEIKLREKFTEFSVTKSELMAWRLIPVENSSNYFNRLIELARGFGVINELAAAALHKLAHLRHAEEGDYSWAIGEEPFRRFVIDFLGQVLNPFANYNDLSEEQLRAEAILACAILAHMVVGDGQMAQQLQHAHAGLALDRSPLDLNFPENDANTPPGKSGTPQSVTGLTPKVREVAKDLARRAGMTLDEWTKRVILEDEGLEGATNDIQVSNRTKPRTTKKT